MLYWSSVDCQGGKVEVEWAIEQDHIKDIGNELLDNVVFFYVIYGFYPPFFIRSNNLMKEKGVGIYNKHSSYACFHI